MRKSLLIVAVCTLSGCIGFLDKMTREVPTNLFLMNHEVCAVSIMKPGEKMVSAEIFSTGEGKRFELFPDKPRYIAAGDCLPIFSTAFRAGEKYALYWNVVPLKGDAYLISANFTLSTDSAGHLSLTDDSTR
ncbi:putative T6SS immunity periplasmic lipoprotein [Kosakonia cowanii]|uniref:putative T6SS immunity periplasmic lipoprotein n=1 Tax=Kosakonia cowanii TaxID=208223 RepID=UPI00289E6131|nr:putative T6SS immunity periplasmic lipoprotein [Kosakonia cowanii]